MRFHSLFIGSTLLLTNKAASAFVTRQAFQQSVTTPATATTMTTRYRILQRQQQHRLFMGFLSNLFKAPELASAQEIKAALQNMSRNKVTVIDVRSPGEIAEDGKVTIDGCKWINTPATPFGCPGLSSDTENILPDKNGKIVAGSAL